MVYSSEELAARIEEFKKRLETERNFCEELFELSTINVLAHKYLYYEKHNAIIEDYAYDCIESSWYIMGRALGVLGEDVTSPCVDFNYKHPLAERAIAKVSTWKRGKL
jgi:hypothetical protein